MADVSNSSVNLIVNYLPLNFTEDDLHRLFQPFGDIVSIKILYGSNGNSQGYGFVKYSDKESAMRAINTLTGIRIYNKILKVGYASPPIPPSERADNLLIKNLPRLMTEEELETILESYGKIVYTKILYEPILYKELDGSEMERLSKGMAIVRFEKLIDAEQAMKALQGTTPPGFMKPIEIIVAPSASSLSYKIPSLNNLTELQDETDPIDENPTAIKPLTIESNEQFMTDLGQPTKGNNLIVRNLNPLLDELSLYALFKPYGNVIWVKIARHPDSTSRQYGFVEMETENFAGLAIRHLHGIFFLGYKLSVKFNNNIDTTPYSIKCNQQYRKSKQLT